MRMSYLTKEWQAPHLKRHMFEEGSKEIGTNPPYILETLSQTAPIPGVTHGAEGAILEHKYYPIDAVVSSYVTIGPWRTILFMYLFTLLRHILHSSNDNI